MLHSSFGRDVAVLAVTQAVVSLDLAGIFVTVEVVSVQHVEDLSDTRGQANPQLIDCMLVTHIQTGVHGRHKALLHTQYICP